MLSWTNSVCMVGFQWILLPSPDFVVLCSIVDSWVAVQNMHKSDFLYSICVSSSALYSHYLFMLLDGFYLLTEKRTGFRTKKIPFCLLSTKKIITYFLRPSITVSFSEYEWSLEYLFGKHLDLVYLAFLSNSLEICGRISVKPRRDIEL